MTRMRETEVKGIFERAADLAADERRVFLDEACGPNGSARKEVERLLRAHDKAEGFLEPVTPPVIHVPPVVVQEKPGDVIGHYKLLQRIGEGGFGVVYMAEQTKPVRRRVALKIVKLGMDTKQVIARFEAERQALAMMDHPHIAHVFDAGATDTGRPYFVMELVKGIPITAYCDEARLSTAERLKLFATVCQAIQHAHQKGIIHRDIKPTNVLVTLHDGVPVPKVIDFGVAKATETRLTERTLFTEFRQIVGTPEYMSPEQAEMSGLDIDTRADIYSLGVLLYELLTGTKPIDIETLLAKGYGEMLKTIREVDPPRPSTRVSSLGGKARAVAHKRHTAADQLPKALAGDLDWIVMRALEKDRTRRYATAAALAADVERHLQDRPVEARPPSTAYLVRKFVRRNQTGVIAGTIAAAAILAGVVLALVGYVEAGNQRDAALSAETEAVAERNAAQRATEEERQARLREAEARAEAAQAAERAETERDAKEQARLALVDSLQRSEGARLVANSTAWLQRDPSVALLLAIEGAKRRPGPLANHVLLDALDAIPVSERVVPTGIQSPLFAVAALDARGRRCAVAGMGWQVHVLDLERGVPLHVLDGHENRLTSVAFSPDDRRILTASLDWTAGLWDASTGRLLHALRGHQGGILSACYRPDGKQVLTAAEDGNAMLWDAESGEAQHTVEHGDLFTRAAYSPNGTAFLVWSGGGIGVYRTEDAGELWAVGLGEWFHGAEDHESTASIAAAQWSPDDRWVAVTTQDRVLRLLDATTGEQVASEPIPGTHEVRNLRWSGDGRSILHGDGQRLSAWWVDAVEGRTGLTPVPGAFDVPFPYHVDDWRGDLAGDLLAAVHDEGSAALFRFPSLERLALVRGHEGSIAAIRIHPDGHRLVTHGTDGCVRVLDPTPASAKRRLVGEAPAIMWVDVSPDGRHLAAGSGGGQTASLWRTDTGERVHQLRGHWREKTQANLSNWVTCVAFAPGGRQLLTCGMDGTARLWDVAGGNELRVWKPEGGSVWSGAFSPDGTHVAVACRDEVIRVYDLQTGELRAALGDPQPLGRAVEYGSLMATFDPSGTLLAAVAITQREVRLYEVKTGRLLATFPGRTASFSPDGKTLAVSRLNSTRMRVRDGRTSLVDLGTLEVRCEVLGSCALLATPFTPDSTAIATDTPSGPALWDARTGEGIRTFPATWGHCRLSPDGEILALVDESGRLNLWEVATGRLLLEQGRYFTRSVPVFAPDGRWVAVADADATVHLVPVDPLATAEKEKPRDLTDAERERFGVGPTQTGDE